LFLSWEAVQKMINPRLPQFTVDGHHGNATTMQNRTLWNESQSNWTLSNGTLWTPNFTLPNITLTPGLRCGHCNHSFALAPAHLQRARSRHAQPLLLQRRLLSIDSYERLLSIETHGRARRSLQPNWTATGAEIWSSPHFLAFQNHSINNSKQTWICGADLAKELEAWTALGCADALALVLACTALLVCVVTLACVWMMTRRLRQPEDAPAKLGDELSRPPALMTATLVDGEPLDDSPGGSSGYRFWGFAHPAEVGSATRPIQA
jgi:hypothetical protein